MWKFFSFIMTLAARAIKRRGIVANASRLSAAFVGSAGLFAALVGAAPSEFLPDPADPLNAGAQALQLSGRGVTSASPPAVPYSSDPHTGVEEIGTKLELLQEWFCFRCVPCRGGGHALLESDREGVVGFHPEACTEGGVLAAPRVRHLGRN